MLISIKRDIENDLSFSQSGLIGQSGSARSPVVLVKPSEPDLVMEWDALERLLRRASVIKNNVQVKHIIVLLCTDLKVVNTMKHILSHYFSDI